MLEVNNLFHATRIIEGDLRWIRRKLSARLSRTENPL